MASVYTPIVENGHTQPEPEAIREPVGDESDKPRDPVQEDDTENTPIAQG